MAVGWCTEDGVGEDVASRLFRQHLLTSRCAKLTKVANRAPRLEQRVEGRGCTRFRLRRPYDPPRDPKILVCYRVSKAFPPSTIEPRLREDGKVGRRRVGREEAARRRVGPMDERRP
jgi:hypothetical protein